MENVAHPAETTFEKMLPRLTRFASVIQNLANRFKGLTRFLAVTGVVSALMLDWFASRAWGLSLTTAALLGAVLMLPGLVLGWCWYVLDDAGNLPQRLSTWVGQARHYAGDVKQRLQADAPATSGRGRLSDLKQLGGLAYDITAMGSDARDLLTVLGGSLTLTNPVFLLILAISVGLIGLLDLTAAITALLALIR
ncbi:MAG: hypothetical protein ACK443_03955 [Methylococcaceae bacterium]|jgi:hypothetical protein